MKNVELTVECQNAAGHWFEIGKFTVLGISDITEYKYVPNSYTFTITDCDEDGNISHDHIGALNASRWKFNGVVYKPKTPAELIEFHQALESALIDEALK